VALPACLRSYPPSRLDSQNGGYAHIRPGFPIVCRQSKYESGHADAKLSADPTSAAQGQPRENLHDSGETLIPHRAERVFATAKTGGQGQKPKGRPGRLGRPLHPNRNGRSPAIGSGHDRFEFLLRRAGLSGCAAAAPYVTSPSGRGAGCECSRKKRSISRAASGPRGSVKDPEGLPPDQAWPAPWITHCSRIARPLASAWRVRL
jgi:hypothetical protein